MLTIQTTIQKLNTSRAFSRKIALVVVAATFGVSVYIAAFFIHKPVEFSYAGNTCTRQLTLLPAMHATTSGGLAISYKNSAKIGNVELLSTQTCFTPVAAPAKGVATVSAAPLGGLVARKTYAVEIPAPPTVDIAPLAKKIPASLPLELELSEADATFSYELKVGEKTADCKTQDTQIVCDVPALQLAQDETYDVALERKFDNRSYSVVAKSSVHTLRAVKVVSTSIRQKQIVYSVPKKISVQTDVVLTSAELNLVEKSSGKTVDIATELRDKTIDIIFDKPLARDTAYELVATQLRGSNGSSLAKPYVLGFTMSGGPKVASSSVGANRVATNAAIRLSFDQPLKPGQDITNIVKVEGVPARVVQDGDGIVMYLSAGKCQPFTIQVDAGLVSTYGITSKYTWKQTSRTICHSVGTIGYSRQGRPIYAYYFGSSGQTTLYVGALHGSEPSSSSILQAWIAELEANPNRLKNRRVVIVPSVNPDGIAAGTRNNAKNVNLNRNFPTDNWKKNINDTNGLVKGGGGSKPLSEPEAKALANLTSSLSPRLLLSYHAVGSLVVGDVGSVSAQYASLYALKTGYRNATGAGGTFDYEITGSYEEWTHKNKGIPSMVIELSSYTSANFTAHKEAMWAMLP